MEYLNKFSRKELMKLLGIIAMSDGTISKSKNYFNSIKLDTVDYNKCQHDFYDYLCQKVFNKKIKQYRYINNKTKMLSSRLYGKKYILELLTLSPSYQTTKNNNTTNKQFLNSLQPSIKFILNDKNKNLKQFALRTYFDFDGSISPSFRIKNKKDKKGDKIYQYYQVQFGCDINIAETNPNLIKELIILCKMLNLNVIIIKDKRKWSGINGIRISGLDSIKRFIKLGGPITKVKISSKSPRLKGKTKKAICKGVISFLNKNVPLSYYFKSYEKALEKKLEMDKLLMIEINKIK